MCSSIYTLWVIVWVRLIKSNRQTVRTQLDATTWTISHHTIAAIYKHWKEKETEQIIHTALGIIVLTIGKNVKNDIQKWLQIADHLYTLLFKSLWSLMPSFDQYKVHKHWFEIKTFVTMSMTFEQLNAFNSNTKNKKLP